MSTGVSGGPESQATEELLAKVKKSAPELLTLAKEGRPPGELLSRIPWTESVSLDQAFQYALWCAECDSLLGVLGVFTLRPANSEVAWPHRYAHCSRCHANTWFYDKATSVGVKCDPPALQANLCLICGKESKPLEANTMLLDTSAPATKNGLS